MRKEYDSNDLRIICELRDNADLTVRELGERLKMHPNTILKRIKRLEGDGILIKKLSEVDFYRLGYDLRALVHIKVKMNSDWEDEIRKFAAMPQVVSFYAVTGVPDFVAIVQVRGKDELEFVLRKLQKNKVVSKTMTHLMFSCYKHPFEFNPLRDVDTIKPIQK